MKRATIRFILDKRIQYEQGYSVKLKFTYLRKKTLFATRVYVRTEDDFEVLKILDKAPRKKSLKEDQKVLISFWERAKDTLEKLEKTDSVSHHNFKALFRYEDEEDAVEVFSYFQSHIDDLTAVNRVGTATSYQNSLDCFKRFHKRKHLAFEEITPQWLEKFETWMLSLGRSETTVGFYLRSLRTILNKAIDEKIIERDLYPFGKRRFTIPGGRNPKKALTIEELKRLSSLALEQGSSEEKARDMFLFSLLCNGANMMDIMSLKWSNLKGDTITFVREKTKRTTKGSRINIEVQLTGKLQEIIDKWANDSTDNENYIFPFLSKGISEAEKVSKVKWQTTNINKALKKIAQKAGIEKPISTVVARHTYATLLKNSGAPIQYISESLGHSNTTTTQNYLASFEKEQKRKYAELIENLY